LIILSFINKRIAQAIVKCFKGVDWTRQTFVVNGETLKDNNGNALFYSAPEIDKAIKKLNRILRLL